MKIGVFHRSVNDLRPTPNENMSPEWQRDIKLKILKIFKVFRQMLTLLKTAQLTPPHPAHHKQEVSGTGSASEEGYFGILCSPSLRWGRHSCEKGGILTKNYLIFFFFWGGGTTIYTEIKYHLFHHTKIIQEHHRVPRCKFATPSIEVLKQLVV